MFRHRLDIHTSAETDDLSRAVSNPEWQGPQRSEAAQKSIELLRELATSTYVYVGADSISAYYSTGLDIESFRNFNNYDEYTGAF
jgi:hypothetical protein